MTAIGVAEGEAVLKIEVAKTGVFKIAGAVAVDETSVNARIVRATAVSMAACDCDAVVSCLLMLQASAASVIMQIPAKSFFIVIP